MINRGRKNIIEKGKGQKIKIQKIKKNKGSKERIKNGRAIAQAVSR
jgi:hypothetical protein